MSAATAVILCFAFGFVPAVVLSWIYDLTPDGIKKDTDNNQDDQSKAVSVGKLDYLTIVGVVLAVVFVAILTAKQSPDSADTDLASVSNESVAVLPFVNMSNEIDQEYFADGITDDVITGLAKCSFFSVVSRNSTFAYKGRRMEIPKIAGALGARYVLEGSVRRAGGRVRVTAQLIDAVFDNHIWAERFDRDLKDVFEIQDEITNQIVQTIGAGGMSAGNARVARKSDRNLDAWDLYVRAYWHFNRFTLEDFDLAIAALEQAIEIAQRDNLSREESRAHNNLATILNK